MAGKISGCVLLTRKNNDLLLDELFINEEYRGNGIGTSIINNIARFLKPLYTLPIAGVNMLDATMALSFEDLISLSEKKLISNIPIFTS